MFNDSPINPFWSPAQDPLKTIVQPNGNNKTVGSSIINKLQEAMNKGITPIGFTSKIVTDSKGIKQRVFTDKSTKQQYFFPVTTYGNSKATASSTVEPVSTPSTTPAVNSNYGGGVNVTPQAVSPFYYSGADLAKMFGITYDVDSILDTLNKATDAKFDELNTTAERAKQDSLRMQDSAFTRYLGNMRQLRANAAQTGAARGTAAANEMTALLGEQTALSETQNLLNNALLDFAKQRGTARGMNLTNAMNTRNEIAQYLGTLGAQYESNAIQRMIGQLSADAQIRAAGITADADIRAQTANTEYLDKILRDAGLGGYGQFSASLYNLNK